MSLEYYVFDDLETAVNAELYIRQLGQMPIVGVNAKTGEVATGKTKTERWAIPRQRLDGKYVFQRVPKANRDATPKANKDFFDKTFKHVVEPFNPAWFEQIEIE